MEQNGTVLEEKSLNCIIDSNEFSKLGHTLFDHERKSLPEIMHAKEEITSLSLEQLHLNSSSTEIMGNSTEFMTGDKTVGTSVTEKFESNGPFSFNKFDDKATNECFFSNVNADSPSSPHLKSNNIQSSISTFLGKEAFLENSPFSAVSFDDDHIHSNLWLDDQSNPTYATFGSEPNRQKKDNIAQMVNIFRNDFDYTFLEDSFRNPPGNIDAKSANEKLDNTSLFGRSSEAINIIDSYLSEPGSLMGSNPHLEAPNLTSFEVKKEILEPNKEYSGNNVVTNLIGNLYDETLDPDLEEAMQRCIKITKILTSNGSPKKRVQCHENIITRSNSFTFLRPALKKRFLVPPTSPADQPMISMKSVHYKWPEKSSQAIRSRTETIHFAMYAAMKKKHLKETQKTPPGYKKCKVKQTSKSRPRKLNIANKAATNSIDPSSQTSGGTSIAAMSSVTKKDESKASSPIKKGFTDNEGPNANSVYPIGDTGYKITIPSSVSVDASSFAPETFRVNPEIAIITPINGIDQPDYVIESTINSINSDSNNFKNIKTISKYESSKTNFGKKSNSLKMRRKSVLNTKNVVKIQIYTKSPKRMVVTRVKEPITSDDSNSISSGFQLIKSILNHLNNLSSDLVKQICLPLKALQRGYLTDYEINCIVRQGNLLRILSELTNNHKGCLLNGCSMCEIVEIKKAELNRLMNWGHQTDNEGQPEGRKDDGIKRKIIKNNCNQNTSGKFDHSFGRKSKEVYLCDSSEENINENKKEFSEESKSKLKSEFNVINKLDLGVETSNNSRNDMLGLPPDENLNDEASASHIEFNLERLDIGKFSLMSSEMENVMKVFCNSESVLYEIDLRDSTSQPVTLALIRISCKDIIGVNMVSNVITIEFKTFPVLSLFDSKKQNVSMEKLLSLNPTSLLTSLKKQLTVYFLHKLFVKENIKDSLKKFVLNSWPQAKLTSNTEDDILQKSYYDVKYLLYDQREKRQKHLESLLRRVEDFVNLKGGGKKEYQVCCECVNGCRSPLDCWCCRKGNPCLNCCCLSCTNPLNVLHFASVSVLEAKMDVCLMQNIYDFQDMNLRDLLRQTHIMSCCGASMTTKQLIPNLKECDECQAQLSFSWCSKAVVHEENNPRNHCILCMQCQPLLHLHCCNCGICTLASTSGKCTQCM